jgi:hypothetical protein
MENSVTATIDRAENQIHDEPHAFCGKFTRNGWRCCEALDEFYA